MLLCRLGWHRWNQWELILVQDNHDWAAGQSRECKRCGFVQPQRFPFDLIIRDETPAPAQEAGGPKSTTDNEQETTTK